MYSEKLEINMCPIYQIPESWKNPTGTWRVGILHPFSLYPTKLRERVQEHRKEHSWDVGHKPAFAEANKNLQEFENEICKFPVGTVCIQIMDSEMNEKES